MFMQIKSCSHETFSVTKTCFETEADDNGMASFKENARLSNCTKLQ